MRTTFGLLACALSLAACGGGAMESGTVPPAGLSASEGAHTNFPHRFSIVDLGALVPVAINKAETIVANGPQGVVRYKDGHSTSVGTGTAVDINDRGDILATTSAPTIYFEQGGSTLLATPSGTENCYANGINRADQVLGTCGSNTIDGQCPHRAFIWANGTPSVINDYGQQYGAAINDLGDAAYTNDYYGLAPCLGAFNEVASATKTRVNLPSDAACAASGDSVAVDVNDNGDVVGSYAVATTQQCRDLHGEAVFLSTSSGGIGIDSPNGLSSPISVSGLNDYDWVVGSFNQHAYVWVAGTLYDLNDRIPANCSWMLTNAIDVNDAGDIIGTGTVNGTSHGFLLKPA